jgi:hypothetical protein
MKPEFPVNLRIDGSLRSYAKTIGASSALSVLALACAWGVLRAGSRGLGILSAALLVAIAVGAAVIASAGTIVVARRRRGVRKERDLFLELNQSRDPHAVRLGAATAGRASLRRWWARRLLKHDLLVGDCVEVKSWPEIRATLDEQGCLDHLPFMPEMLAMCGRRAVVFRCMHRLFDYRKSRRMRHMDGAVLLAGATCDGARHGGCEAGCHAIWKATWLRKVEWRSDAEGAAKAIGQSSPLADIQVLQPGTQGPRYACQLTALHAASHPLEDAGALDVMRPLVSGNVAPAAFVVGWLTHLFNEVQHLRHGVAFPAFETGVVPTGARTGEAALAAGDPVVVRSSAEIRSTLDDRFMHRGLWFEPDMLKHCGRRLVVEANVSKLIDVVTGEMRAMKTPAFRLQDVHFSGERQLFNAQYEPLLWRSAWLRRDDE